MNAISRFSRQLSAIVVTILAASSALAVSPTVSKPTAPAIELVAVLRINGAEHDLSGLTDQLEDGSPADQLGGFSAIEYSGSGDRFILLPDRGAGDGAVAYPCRMHEAELAVDPNTGTVQWKLLATRLLKSASGQQLLGSLVQHDADLHQSDSSQWQALDPEGIRRLADGSMLISDEYGPRVVQVDENLKVSFEYPIDDRHRLHDGANENAGIGTFPNRGLEGIAITPSGDTTIAVWQSPLIQDGKLESGKCLGLNCRWLVYNPNHQCEREIVYRLDDLSSGVSEILAVDEHRFLVLERNGKAGEQAKVKKIFLADILGASDVSVFDSLPPSGLPESVNSVKKSLFLDLLDTRFGLGGAYAVEKPEGLCWGKPLADGRRTLWVCRDNDFDPSSPSEIYCFAIAGL